MIYIKFYIFPIVKQKEVTMKRLVIIGMVLGSLFLSGCVNKNLLNSYEAHLNVTEAEHMNYVRNGGKPLTKEAIKARELKYKSAREVIRKYKEYSNKWYIFGN